MVTPPFQKNQSREFGEKKKKEKKTNHQRSLDKILYYVSGRDDRRHRPLLGGAHSMLLHNTEVYKPKSGMVKSIVNIGTRRGLLLCTVKKFVEAVLSNFAFSLRILCLE